jgi:hypothetical protein
VTARQAMPAHGPRVAKTVMIVDLGGTPTLARRPPTALVGNPDDVAGQIAARFHPDDRLMLWFDFFNHDNDHVIDAMSAMVTQVVPRLRALGIPVDTPPSILQAARM